MSQIIRPRNSDEPKIMPNGEPVIFSEGRIGAIVKFPVLVDEGEGYAEKTFEKYLNLTGIIILLSMTVLVTIHDILKLIK